MTRRPSIRAAGRLTAIDPMRKACRRKRFALRLSPVRLAFLGDPAPPADWHTIRVRELLGIDALTAGTAQRHDLAQLLAGIQTAVGLAGMGYGPEALPELQAGRAALRAIYGQESGAMQADAAALAALREALAVVDAQREVVPRRDHERAAAQAMQMIEGTGCR